MSIQTDDTTNALSANDQTRNYEEELVAQTAIAYKAKEQYEKAKAKADKLKEEAEKTEAELQQFLNDRTA